MVDTIIHKTHRYTFQLERLHVDTESKWYHITLISPFDGDFFSLYSSLAKVQRITKSICSFSMTYNGLEYDYDTLRDEYNDIGSLLLYKWLTTVGCELEDDGHQIVMNILDGQSFILTKTSEDLPITKEFLDDILTELSSFSWFSVPTYMLVDHFTKVWSINRLKRNGLFLSAVEKWREDLWKPPHGALVLKGLHDVLQM